MDISSIEYVVFQHIMKRGTGKIIEENDNYLLIFDSVSEGYYLACADHVSGMKILEKYITKDWKLLMVTEPERKMPAEKIRVYEAKETLVNEALNAVGASLGKKAARKYDFNGPMECYQFAFLNADGEEVCFEEEVNDLDSKRVDGLSRKMIEHEARGLHVEMKDGEAGKLLSEMAEDEANEMTEEARDLLSVRVADENDFSMLSANYDLISKEELKDLVMQGNILLGYDEDRLVGFIGQHHEGSMGLLYIFPEYRKKGYGSRLEQVMIKKIRKTGFIPYCHVITDNKASIRLQKGLGLVQTKNTVSWMWK